MSGIERCPLLGGYKYFYGKSNWGHGICPLYRGCPPLRESVIRVFTVSVYDSILFYYYVVWRNEKFVIAKTIDIIDYRIYSNRTQAKKIITILTFARFSGKGRQSLH